MAVAVRVLLAALSGLYWSSTRVEGTHRELNRITGYKIPVIFRFLHNYYTAHEQSQLIIVCP